jgi:hypothetical protein
VRQTQRRERTTSQNSYVTTSDSRSVTSRAEY